MLQRLFCLFGLPVGECDFGLQRQCENLLRRLQCVQLNLLQNAAGLRAVALLNALVGSCQAQLGGLFGVALLSLLQQLLSGCLRRPGQFAERGRGGAGAGCEQGGDAEEKEGA